MSDASVIRMVAKRTEQYFDLIIQSVQSAFDFEEEKHNLSQ
jgi:hypothetical protein